MLLSKCDVCDSKNSKLIKKQEVSGLLSSLGIKTSLNYLYFIRYSFAFRVFNKLIQDIK